DDAVAVEVAFSKRTQALTGSAKELAELDSEASQQITSERPASSIQSGGASKSEAAGQIEPAVPSAGSAGLSVAVAPETEFPQRLPTTPPSLVKISRRRDPEHLRFIASKACLVCARLPSDPHHLRFAQPRALGRKASDEFTVPLCRAH